MTYLDLLLDDSPLLFLCPGALLLHPHKLGVPLAVELVLALLPLAGKLVFILGELSLIPGILLRRLAGLLAKDPLSLLQRRNQGQ